MRRRRPPTHPRVHSPPRADRKPVNLNEIVMDALQFTRFERPSIASPSWCAGPDLPPVRRTRSDHAGARQLALQRDPCRLHPRCEFPKILISTFVNDADMAEIAVADNGPGVAPSDVPRIFDPFSPRNRAVGLGLPISRSIIESHGGKLECDSQPGESTVFRVTLPRQSPVEGFPRRIPTV